MRLSVPHVGALLRVDGAPRGGIGARYSPVEVRVRVRVGVRARVRVRVERTPCRCPVEG